jgi:short-subunit dehydrogenase
MARPLAAITGASAGLGAVFARKLAARGYDLLLIARRRDRLEALGAELSKAHSINADCFTADLATTNDMERVGSRLAGEPELALLVNNAGFGTKGRFYEAPVEEQIRMHRVHVDATLRLSRAALTGMVARNRGAIINVASVAGFLRSPGSVSYCATKAWINAFTEGLYLELAAARANVSVQALCPGFTYTEFHDVVGMDRALIPKWLWMTADEVVDASLAAMATRKLYVVPGWKYKLLVAIATRLPVGIRLALEAGSPHRRDKR